MQSQIIIKKPGYLENKVTILTKIIHMLKIKRLFFTIHLFLEKATKTNGTLFVYPKTHKLGLLKFNSNKSFDNLKNAGNKIDIKEWKKNTKKYILMRSR